MNATSKAEEYFQKRGISPTVEEFGSYVKSHMSTDRIIPTVADLAVRFGKGVISSPEHMIDFFVTLAGLVPYIAGDEETVQKIQDFVKQDLVGDAFSGAEWAEEIFPDLPGAQQALDDFRKSYKNLTATSALNEDNVLARLGAGAAESIGGMGFDALTGGMVVGIASKFGTSVQTAQKVYQAASLTSLGLRSAGASTAEAFNDGAGYLQGLGYGILRGATEVATEKMFDVNPFYTGSKITKGGVRGFFKGMAEEGTEELASGIVEPLSKAIYKGPEALKEYGTMKYWNELGEEFLSGAAIAGIAGGATGQLSPNNIRAGTAIEGVENARSTLKKMSTMYANGKLTSEEYSDMVETVKQNYRASEKALTEMSEKARTKLFESNPELTTAFNKDGTIRPAFAAQVWGGESAQAQNTRLSAEDKINMTPNRRNSDQLVIDTIQEINQNKDMVKNGETVSLYKGELSSEQSAALKPVLRMANNINQQYGTDIGVVVVESNSAKPIFYETTAKRSQTIYVNANMLGRIGTLEEAAQIGIEEIDHVAQVKSEGEYSDEYKALQALGEQSEVYQGIVDELTREGNPYGFTREMYDEIVKNKGKFKIVDGKVTHPGLSAKAEELLEEIDAHVAAKLLSGNKEFINEYAKEDTRTQSFLNALDKVSGWFSRMTSKEARAEYKQLQAVKEAFLGALAERGRTYQNGKIIAAKLDDLDEEAEKEKAAEAVDSEDGVRYNRDSDTYTEKQYRDYGWARANDIISASESEELRSKFADIKKNNHYYPQTKSGDYMIEIGKDGQKIAFMRGTITNPVISSVIEIYANGMELDNERSVIYENERRGIPQTSGDIFRRYNAADFQDSWTGKSSESVGNSGGVKLQRGTSGTQAQGAGQKGRKRAISYHFNDDGSQEITYSDGTTELRFSRLPANAESLAEQHFGTTTRWKETGYLTTDGKMLDFSGRHWGGEGGGRDVDHMDIREAFEGAEGYKTDGQYREEQFDFVNRGNIRIAPETPGINLSVEPTEAQYAKLRSFFSLNRNREIVVDYDNANGKTVDSQAFKAGTSAASIIESIKQHFAEGTRSDLMRFHTEEDLRFSRSAQDSTESATQAEYNEDGTKLQTKGQRAKFVANNTTDRVYSRTESAAEINRIISEVLSKKYGKVTISGGKSALIEQYWTKLNELSRIPKKTKAETDAIDKTALQIADYIIDHAMVKQAVLESIDKQEGITATEEQIESHAKSIKSDLDIRDMLAEEIKKSVTTIGSASTFNKNTARKVRLALWNARLAKELVAKVEGKSQYVAADVLNSPEMVAWIETLKPLAGKALYSKDARRSILELKKFYNEKNELLNGYIDDTVLEAIDEIVENGASDSYLSQDEMEALHTILAGMKKLYESYDLIDLAGKRQHVTDVAVEGYKQLTELKNTNANKSWLERAFMGMVEPRVVIEMMEGFHDNGVLSRMYEEILRGETKKKALYMQMMLDFDQFFKEHKKYQKRLAKTEIELQGHALTIGQAISIYELFKRDQARAGLEQSGITFEDRKGNPVEIDHITANDVSAIEDLFTEEDKEFIIQKRLSTLILMFFSKDS